VDDARRVKQLLPVGVRSPERVAVDHIGLGTKIPGARAWKRVFRLSHVTRHEELLAPARRLRPHARATASQPASRGIRARTRTHGPGPAGGDPYGKGTMRAIGAAPVADLAVLLMQLQCNHGSIACMHGPGSEVVKMRACFVGGATANARGAGIDAHVDAGVRLARWA